MSDITTDILKWAEAHKSHGNSTVTYKNWHIVANIKPIPDRRHDYDVTHIGYNGPGDDRHFCAASVEDAMAEIDALEDDNETETG